MRGAFSKGLPAWLIAGIAVAPLWIGSAPTAGFSSNSTFAKSPRIEKVDLYCARKGAKKGRIYVEARVAYSDVRESLDPAYSGQTQSLQAKLTLSTRSGKRLARLWNKGTGKTVITDEDRFEYTHRAILSRGTSRRVLRRVHRTTACTKRHETSKKLGVRVRAKQTLKRKAASSVTQPGRHTQAPLSQSASRALTSSQSASKTVTRPVKTVPEADRLISGCPISPRTKCTAADLTDAMLNKADLSNAILSAADLSKANLTDAALDEAKLVNANLTGTDLTNAVAYGANLTNAALTNAKLTIGNFTETTLVNANLTGAKLDDADLTSADLGGASLSGADLASADLSGANLSGASLGGATCNDETVWPDGTSMHGTLCP